MLRRTSSPSTRLLPAWNALVDRFGREDDQRLVARAFRQAVALLVVLLGRATGVAFPARTTGGWQWGPRWRLEWLLSWNEAASVAWLRRNLPLDGCFVDLGAHIGYYSRIAADAVGPGGRVLAVEPHPENLAVLRGNLALRPQVAVEPVAVGAASGTVTLWESAGSSNHSLFQGFTGSSQSLDVQVVPVDDLVARHGLHRVDVVKIDVEGSELAALRGMRRTLGVFRPALIVERNPRALEAAGSSADELLTLLDELEYEVHVVSVDGSDELVPIADMPRGDDEALRTINMVCGPRARRTAR